MSRRDIIIRAINSTPITFSPKITLDNLDKAELVVGENSVLIENEHGTRFELECLSDKELEIFAELLNIPTTYDFLIVDEENNWLSFGTGTTEEEIIEGVGEIKQNHDGKIIVFKSADLIKTEY